MIDNATHIFERFLSTKQRYANILLEFSHDGGSADSCLSCLSFRSIRLITYNANHKIGKSQQLAKKKMSGNKSYYESEDAEHPHTLGDDSDLLVCETKDLVKVGVRADVFYSIVDPEKCIQTLNTGKSIPHCSCCIYEL